MEGFIEQVVKRVNKPKQLIIKIVAVLLLITVPLGVALLAPVVGIPYLIYVGFFIFIGGIYAVWYVFSQQKVDFEYSVTDDELSVAKIISLRKRKNLCKVKIRDIERLDKGEKTIEGLRISKTFEAAHDIDKESENFYAVFNSAAYGKSVLIFSPNEEILQAMKRYLNREIVVKLFYQQKVI
ncbi:MAG: hypothetical protein U0L58_05200 [Ruminococcus sp.]|nr:hypothetical protein [Ruminococcus sp.]MEE0856674.1 hypothetical protein [Ruminococcus sp.]